MVFEKKSETKDLFRIARRIDCNRAESLKFKPGEVISEILWKKENLM